MLTGNKPILKLPEGFKKYFWDVAFDELSLEKYPRFVAERLLNYGDLNVIEWLLAATSREFIRSVVKTSRNLNAKTKNYWQILLNESHD
jgi:hypothetical protein